MKWPLCKILFISTALLSMAAPAQSDVPPGYNGSLVVQAEIPKSGDFMAFGFDSLWMISGRRLLRVDPKDNSFVEIALKSSIGGRVRGICIGEGAVWVPDVSADLIHKIDPNSNQEIKEIPAQMLGSEGSIGVGEGSVWVVTEEGLDRTLARFNAATGEVEAKINLPDSGAAALVDFGSVWVTAGRTGELYRIDPESNTIVSTTSLHEQPRFLTSGEGSIWVLNQGDGTVQRIDPTGNVIATIEAGLVGGGGDITTGGGYVWVTTRSVPVAKIDPKTNTFIGKFYAIGMGDAIRYGAGSLWVSGQAIHRIEPPN
jgi:streptogramin lyase